MEDDFIPGADDTSEESYLFDNENTDEFNGVIAGVDYPATLNGLAWGYIGRKSWHS